MILFLAHDVLAETGLLGLIKKPLQDFPLIAVVHLWGSPVCFFFFLFGNYLVFFLEDVWVSSFGELASSLQARCVLLFLCYEVWVGAGSSHVLIFVSQFFFNKSSFEENLWGSSGIVVQVVSKLREFV